MLRNTVNEFPPMEILLKYIRIDSDVHGFGARVSIEQIFWNISTENIEVIYHFPIEPNATMCSFVARFDRECEIQGELKEKSPVDQAHDDFRIHLGILKSNSQCHIQITYLTELDLVTTNILRLMIPNIFTKNFPVNQRVDFNCAVRNDRMSYVSCLSHLNAAIEDKRAEQSKVFVKLSDAPFEREIIIDVFLLRENRFDSIVAVESGGLLTGFITNNPFDEYDEICQEFLFLVDCSVRMKENDSMELARQVLQRFWNILPINCRFNIVRFGSTFHCLFDRTITDQYSAGNSKKAKKFIGNLQADLNGMNLIEPLKWLYDHPPKLNRPRQILLLMGSQVSNVNETIDLGRKMATHSRIFTVGLGLSSNPVLVKELARVTNGKSILIPPNARVEFYIADQLQRILHFSFNNISIRWTCPSEKNPIQMIAPIIPPNVLFSETKFLVYALLDETQSLDQEIKIQLIETRTQRERCLATARINHIPVIHGEQDKIITRLAARAIIQALADLDDTESKLMLDLSLKFGIPCPLTTFVMVERYLNDQ